MLANPVLARLHHVVPAWFAFPKPGDADIKGFATVPGTRWSRQALDLTITPRGRGAAARETAPFQLPIWCPELHLNNDRSFCQGIDRLAVVDTMTAEQWWADLEIHLRLLSVALATGVWPLHSGLDHDEAGHHQRAARRIADELGILEEYERILIGEPSWLDDHDAMFVDARGHFTYRGVRCPCGCSERAGRFIAARNCSRRIRIASLIRHERARKSAIAAFWVTAKESGQSCCGMMRDCPLKTS